MAELKGMTEAPMLKDGSNPEGVLPSPTLVWRKTDKVVVHGPKMSPAVNKIRTYLTYAGIAYKHKAHLPSGIRPGPYSKVPNVDVAGRQVNDSYIILQLLVPAMDKGLVIDLEWERKFVLFLDTGLKLQTPDSDWAKLAVLTIDAPRCLSGLISRNMIGPLERKQGTANTKNALGHKDYDVIEIAKEFRAAMGSNSFVGGEQPGTADLSFYGVLSNYLHAQCSISENMMIKGDLVAWRERMETLIPLKSLY